MKCPLASCFVVLCLGTISSAAKASQKSQLRSLDHADEALKGKDGVNPKDMSDEEVIQAVMGDLPAVEAKHAVATARELEEPAAPAAAPMAAPAAAPVAAPAAAPMASPAASPEAAPAAAPMAAGPAAAATTTSTEAPAAAPEESWLPWWLNPWKIWQALFGGPPKHEPATLEQIKGLDPAVFAPAPLREEKKEDTTFAPAPWPKDYKKKSSLLAASGSVKASQETSWLWLWWPFPEVESDESEAAEESRAAALSGGVAMVGAGDMHK
eukprot:gb/GFBE01020545.1/.p1 GENE.gb/GFBE01020545.1/~~gb/GFBE01020545.1/.p1  ORF type:complete len:268 (+),score=67.48 gb/GFBE01020545.1/:1-804(+)